MNIVITVLDRARVTDSDYFHRPPSTRNYSRVLLEQQIKGTVRLALIELIVIVPSVSFGSLFAIRKLVVCCLICFLGLCDY